MAWDTLEKDRTERETRLKFYDAARGMYPDCGDPGVVWVLSQVLKWDWDDVTLVCQDGFDRKGYARIVRDSRGYLQEIVRRPWTREEARELSSWWWLLNL